MNKETPIRELFIEELADVQGGAPADVPETATTMACCEELIFSGCCLG